MGFREELTDYSDRSARILADSPQMDEENTKRKIIEPLVELLGWDILSADVELEYSVQIGSGTKKVDYALKIEETPVVFIEAKGADTQLTSSNEDQLRSYMRQVGVDWGLLSNGREFAIFRRDYASNRPNEISLAEFTLEEIADKKQPLSALSKDSLESGKSRQIAEKIEAVQQAVRALRAEKEGIAEDVTRVVTEEIGETASQQVENEAKNFVDDLIATLETQADENVVEDPPKPEPESAFVIRILRSGSEIERLGAETQAEAMTQFVNYLIETEGLLEEIELPYVPGSGRGSHALVNDEPVHTDGDEMRSYKELVGGYYLFTSLNANSKQRYISELAEKVNLESDFINW